MSAFLFTLVLFLFWGLIGFALISVFSPRLRLIQGVLISPAVGVAMTILPVYFMNRAGMPVKDFGQYLLLAFVIVAVLALIIKRPNFPIKRSVPYAWIILAALFLAATPMFHYGFDWLSFSNDDMANYCLGAQRFLNHGYFELPNLDDFFSGKDYSLAYWFMHVAGGVRSGSELMLAVIWAATSLNAHQIFMPVIMALDLTLIAGVGAMVSGVGSRRRTPIIAMTIMALSPMTTLGALYQLIGQVGGLSLLCAAVTLMYRARPIKPIFRQFIGVIPAVVVFIAIFIWYPEVFPFFGLGWLIYLILSARQGGKQVLKIALPALLVGVFAFIVLNKQLVAALLFMQVQATAGMQGADLSTVLFPYFLVPSGGPALWGLIAIAAQVVEPYLSLVIAVSWVLMYWLLRRVVWSQIRKVSAPIGMLLVMLLMAALLFYRRNDFGLFKLAMYIQPFIFGAVAIELANLKWKDTSRVRKIAIAFVLISLGMTQSSYVEKSTGESSGSLNEIPDASSKKINKQFEQIFNSARKEHASGYMADTTNVVLAKYQALYTQGERFVFPSQDYFSGVAGFSVQKYQGTAISNFALNYENLKKQQYLEHEVATDQGPNKFYMRRNIAKEIADYPSINTVGNQTIFNRVSDNQNNIFVLEKSPENHMTFVFSSLGNHYYMGDSRKISFFQLENDPMFPGQKFSALGRHFLFLVTRPTDQSRIVMELTDTVVKQFASELPRPEVQRVPLGFVGRGSGRIFSAPVQPTYIDGVPYIAIDMGRDGRRFSYPAKGLMQFYGTDVPTDRRWVSAFGRDISLVTQERYLNLQPPSNLQAFPADLANKDLEYSGIYEDGWISEKSFFSLQSKPTSRFIVVKGMVPLIKDPNFTSELKVSVDGKELARKKLGLGNYELKIPITGQEQRRRIDIDFAGYQQLPGADGRMTGGKIDFIGFTEN